jgi:hypothetical protein
MYSIAFVGMVFLVVVLVRAVLFTVLRPTNLRDAAVAGEGKNALFCLLNGVGALGHRQSRRRKLRLGYCPLEKHPALYI